MLFPLSLGMNTSFSMPFLTGDLIPNNSYLDFQEFQKNYKTDYKIILWFYNLIKLVNGKEK